MARREMAGARRDLKKRTTVRKKSSAAEVIREATRLLLRGEHERARQILAAAIEREPENVALLTRYGDALYRAERVTEARDAYRRALAADEEQVQAWYGCGMAEFSYEEYAHAIECFRQAVRLAPRDRELRLWLGRALFGMGDVDAAMKEWETAANSRNAAERRIALRLIASLIPQSPRHGNADVLRMRKRWTIVEAKSERARHVRLAARARSKEKLRIGYVSSFFHHRNWMKPVWAVINSHDRAAFEIHLFADQGLPSSESGYLSGSGDRIHEITQLTNAEAAREIAKAGVDVLVDLNGYSSAERLGIFRWKPAAAVVGWFNMFATTGIGEFDYIVGDAAVIPEEEERFYSERVLRVSGTYIAFRVLYPVPEVTAPPCLQAGRITFGCFAPQYKITDEMISTWSQILGGAPQSRLLLKSTCLEKAANREAVMERFVRHGIGGERLILEGPEEHYKFLEAYARVDVALDTFPYNGGTTTTESLWQGVPVLAMDGDRWVSRTSKSPLRAAGMDDWVMRSKEEYVRRAVDLANSGATGEMLAGMRSEMREKLLGSRACDAVGLCRELEAHYRHAAEAIRPSRRLKC
jgi:predicted O-linked N-acetylglucosamine transferase (SPINDLY family)